jgi:hypothetical protein
MSEFVRVLTSSLITINRVASILEEKDIPALIKDNTESARLAGFGISQNEVDLYVKKLDFEKAKKVIQQFEEEV